MDKKTTRLIFLVISAGVLVGVAWWWTSKGTDSPDLATPTYTPLPTGEAINLEEEGPLFTPPPLNSEEEGRGVFSPSPTISQTVTGFSVAGIAGAYYWEHKTGTSTEPVLVAINANNGTVVAHGLPNGAEELWGETELAGLRQAEFQRVGDDLRLIILQEKAGALRWWLATISQAADSNKRTLAVRPLSSAVSAAVFSPDQQKIFYLEENDRGVIGWVSDWEMKTKTRVWETSHRDWVVSWSEKNYVTFVTRASANAPGFAYRLNLQSKEWEKLLGPVNGLTLSISPDGQNWLYSESRAGENPGWRLVWKKGTEEGVLPFLTWPEKCVWSSDSTVLYCGVPKNPAAGTYPDDWYLGTTNFDDEWWSVDLGTGEARLLDQERGERFDSWRPRFVAPGLIHFLNKENGAWHLANWQIGL